MWRCWRSTLREASGDNPVYRRRYTVHYFNVYNSSMTDEHGVYGLGFPQGNVAQIYNPKKGERHRQRHVV